MLYLGSPPQTIWNARSEFNQKWLKLSNSIKPYNPTWGVKLASQV